MALLTPESRATLVTNYRLNQERQDRGEDPLDFEPPVKLFTPFSAGSWLLTELEPEDNVCDLGMGHPELGYVSLTELESLEAFWGPVVEQDLYFAPEKTLGAYAEASRVAGRIEA